MAKAKKAKAAPKAKKLTKKQQIAANNPDIPYFDTPSWRRILKSQGTPDDQSNFQASVNHMENDDWKASLGSSSISDAGKEQALYSCTNRIVSEKQLEYAPKSDEWKGLEKTRPKPPKVEDKEALLAERPAIVAFMETITPLVYAEAVDARIKRVCRSK